MQGQTVTNADDPYAGVSRNALCPCGSGKKYKRCHGAPGGPTDLTARPAAEEEPLSVSTQPNCRAVQHQRPSRCSIRAAIARERSPWRTCTLISAASGDGQNTCTLRTWLRSRRTRRSPGVVPREQRRAALQVGVDPLGGPPQQLARTPVASDHLDDRAGEPVRERLQLGAGTG